MMKKLLGKIALWYLRGCVKNSKQDLHNAANDLYKYRSLKPELEDKINRVLDEEIYPAITALDELYDDME